MNWRNLNDKFTCKYAQKYVICWGFSSDVSDARQCNNQHLKMMKKNIKRNFVSVKQFTVCIFLKLWLNILLTRVTERETQRIHWFWMVYVLNPSIPMNSPTTAPVNINYCKICINSTQPYHASNYFVEWIKSGIIYNYRYYLARKDSIHLPNEASSDLYNANIE